MSDHKKNSACQMGCWAMAAVAGLLTFVMLLTVGGYTFMPAAFVGAIAFILLGLLFGWLFCTPLPSAVDRSATGSTSAAATSGSTAPSAGATASVAAGASAAVASTSSASDADKAAADKAAADKAAADKAAADKAAADKAEADKAAAKKKAAADKKAAKAAADKAAADAASGEDYDGGGVREGANEGTKPATLTAAREGGADDLKRIKGIGPKLEKLCNTMGFFHFDQIAAWTPDEMAWVNANLEGFKGRATRDKWIEQAKLLASGAETEFSKRVDKGSVY
ncbi:endonuclease [Planktotalea frisia]|uniref:endonuclease n=1 Tax=Planktotalea frisia TaxID=696762 RepID=UPI0023549B0E|nr:endonuclease [Planktotalea frisia]